MEIILLNELSQSQINIAFSLIGSWIFIVHKVMCVYIMQAEVMLSGKTRKTNGRGRGRMGQERGRNRKGA